MNPIRNMLGGVVQRTPSSPRYGEAFADRVVGALRPRTMKDRIADMRPVAGGASVKEMIDKRATVWSEMEEIVKRADGSLSSLPGEDIQKYRSLEKDLDGLTSDIEAAQKHDEQRKRFEEVNRDSIVNPGGGESERSEGGEAEKYAEAFDVWLRFGQGEMEAEQRQILRKGYVQGKELRAQGVSSGGIGGFTVPEGFWDKITETMKFFGGMRQVANVISTETGATLPWPTNDDTGNKGARLAENTAVTEQDITFGAKDLSAYMYTSKMVRVALQFLQDTATDAEGYLGRKLGERIGRIHNEEFTTGTGVDQPEGIVTGAAVGRVGAAGQVASVTLADIIRLEHSVDPAYRESGRARFMFHDLTLAALRLLLDADGRPLWQPTLQAGVPDNFNGRPYVVNNDMPQMAANAKSILFGDFEAGYVIRDVRSVQLMRLDERFAEFLQVAFLAFARADGAVDDAGAFKAYQNPAA